jgi:hypothetical protein
MVKKVRWATGPFRTGVEDLTSIGTWSPAHPAHSKSLYLTTLSCSPSWPYPSQTQTTHNLTPNFFRIILSIYVHLWLGPISGNWPLYFLLKAVFIFHCAHDPTCPILPPQVTSSFLFDHSNSIWQEVQINKLSLVSCSHPLLQFLSLLWTPSVTSLHLWRRGWGGGER